MPQGDFGTRLRELRSTTGGTPRLAGSGKTPAAEANSPTKPAADNDGGSMQFLQDLLTGGAKGAGQTLTNLGDLLRLVPGMNQLDKLMAPLEFSTEATNTAQKLGKMTEQVGEFFVPGGAIGRAATGGLMRGAVKMAPNMGAKGAKLANTMLPKAGKVVGDAANATLVSAAHGDPNPEIGGAVAGGTSLAGMGLSSLAPLLNTPAGKTIGPYLAALAAMHAGGGVTPTGLAAGGATFNLARRGAQSFLKRPNAIPNLRRSLESGSRAVGTAGAGVVDSTRPQRRRLQMAIEE